MNMETPIAAAPGSPFARRHIDRRMRLLEIQPLDEARPIVRRGLVIAGAFVGFFALFAAVAPFSSAAIASGELVTSGDPLAVQPIASGMVSRLMVHEGDHVRKGQPLVLLDPLRSGGALAQAQGRYDALRAAEARLAAEAGGGTLAFPSELTARSADPQVARLLAAEREEYVRRKALRDADVLANTTDASAARAQAVATAEQQALIGDELASQRQLYARGFARKTTVRALERSAAQLAGQRAASDAAVAQNRIAAQKIRDGQRMEIAQQLAQTREQIVQIEPQLRIAADNSARGVLRAPAEGRVSGVSAIGPGAMVGGGKTLMTLVPDGAGIVADVSVKPADIDDVRIGQKATLRFSTVNPHGRTSFDGHVVRLSPDRVGEGAASGYRAQVRLDDPAAAKREGLTLQPGIPLSANIETRERSIFDYLFFTFTDAMSRTFRSE